VAYPVRFFTRHPPTLGQSAGIRGAAAKAAAVAARGKR
jgi:hypothetical protein